MKFHPRDLYPAYTLLFRHNPHSQDDFIKTAHFLEDVVSNRILEHNFFKPYRSIFWLGAVNDFKRRRFLSSPTELRSIADQLKEFHQTQFQAMEKFFFGKIVHFDYPRYYLLNSLYDAYDPELTPENIGVPADRDTFIYTLDKIRNSGTYATDKRIISQTDFTKLVLNYLEKTFIYKAGSNDLNKEEVRLFLQEIKRTNIRIDLTRLESPIERDSAVSDGKKYVSLPAKNLETARQIMLEVFGEETSLEITGLEITGIGESLNSLAFFGDASHFIEKIVQVAGYINKNKASFTENQTSFANQFYEAIGKSHFDYKPRLYRNGKTGDNIFLYMNDEDFDLDANIPPKEKEILNDKIIKCHLRLLVGVYLYQEDSEQFYAYVKKTMDESGLNLSNFNNIGLTHLISPLTMKRIFTKNGFEYLHIKELAISDFESFCSLPFLQEIISRQNQLEFSSIANLNTHLGSILHDTGLLYNLYSDSWVFLLLGQASRQNFLKLLENGVEFREYGDLLNFVSTYFPDGYEKSYLVKQINSAYLSANFDGSPTIEEKIDYLKTNIQQVGLEGMLIVANQITSLKVYKHFRQEMYDPLSKYLDGTVGLSAVALADYLTSFTEKGFGKALDTCISKPTNSRLATTDLALSWINGSHTAGTFDKDNQVFRLGTHGREVFISFSDMVESLKALSPTKRFAIAMKLLTDAGGALSSAENRKILGDKILESLELSEESFVGKSLSVACNKADAKLIAFPTAQIIAPLLFSAYDKQNLDYESLGDKTNYIFDNNSRASTVREYFGEEGLRIALNSSTRSLTLFGTDYQNQPEGFMAKRARESDEAYHKTLELLHTLFPEEPANNDKKNGGERPKVADSIEGVIRGIEATGSLGIRSLQLARQIRHFSPEIDRRLSETLDSNPGLNKLLFWENLLKLVEQDPKIAQFATRIVEVGEYLGGGSLFTTYQAVIFDEEKKKDSVLKMLNPNATAFINTVYKLAQDTFDEVARTGTSRDIRDASTATTLVDLSQEWCLKDINDHTFEEDDNLFGQTVEEYNKQKKKSRLFAVPKRVLTTYRLKSEELAHGRTLNSLLNDPRVDIQTKKDALSDVARFFLFQLKARGFYDKEGVNYRLFHADPHPGNYLMENGQVNIVDRHMYLKLSREDCDLVQSLISGNYLKFLHQLTMKSLDTNKVRGFNQRTRTQVNVQKKVYQEMIAQKTRKEKDSFALLKSAFSALEEQNLHIPLETRLMIRNVFMWKQLLVDYDLSFDSI